MFFILLVAGTPADPEWPLRAADDLLHRADSEHLDQKLDLHLVEILEEALRAARAGEITAAVSPASVGTPRA